MGQESTLRERIIALFTDRLGEAEQAQLSEGAIYRWRLSRGPREVSLLVTIDSPEWRDMAHVLISDSPTFQVDPVTSVTVYTIEEAEALLDRIEAQWKSVRPHEGEPQHQEDASRREGTT